MAKPKTLDEQKKAFLRRIFGNNYADKTADDFVRQAWKDAATSMRQPLYSEGAKASESRCAELRRFVQGEIMSIVESGGYACEGKRGAAQKAAMLGVEAAHIPHIVKLQEAVKRKHRSSLADGKLRFGVAQKLLNMYLKYMWCAGKMTETPPHCPFDRKIIIDTIPSQLRKDWRQRGIVDAWSKSKSKKDYRAWLAAAKDARKPAYDSVAVWELFEFEKRTAGE